MSERICLIIPGSIFLSDARTFITIGILRIASVLESVGYVVDVLDFSGIANPLNVLADYVRQYPTRMFGITSTTPQMPETTKICRALREHRPEARLILGGPHCVAVSIAKKREAQRGIVGRAHEAFFKVATLVDVIVAGDGEDAIFLALSENPPSWIDADDPSVSMFLSKERISSLPPIARHLVDLESYHYYIDGRRSTSMMFAQGCPFQCRYCSLRFSPSFRRVRQRTTESILEEIREIVKKWHLTGIQIYDDEIGLSQTAIIKDLRAIIDLEEKMGIDLRLRGFVKAELLTPLQAKLMYECGFREICVGIESGAPRILQNIKKQATIDDNYRCVEIAKANNLKIKCFTSIGHPGETEETIQQTQEFLIQADVDSFDTTIISPFPGVNYYDEAVPHKSIAGAWTYTAPETGDTLHSINVDYTENAQYYKGDRNLGYVSHVFTDALSQEDLVKMRDWVEDSVRTKLNLPYCETKAALLYDHSSGQIPLHILRSSSF